MEAAEEGTAAAIQVEVAAKGTAAVIQVEARQQKRGQEQPFRWRQR